MSRRCVCRNFSIINSTELDEACNKGDKFDVLVIDEGQQLCRTENLDKLDKLLESGLENGRWRWFGDPQHQVIEKELFDEEVYKFVCNLGLLIILLKYRFFQLLFFY